MITKDNDYIWRIESGSGHGAYKADIATGEGKYYGSYHPALYSEGMDYDNRHTSAHLFGFNSILQARRWFTSIHDLADAERREDGAFLVAYRLADVRDPHVTPAQAIFIPADAKKVRMPASDLHRLRVRELVANVETLFAHLSDSVA